MTIAELQIQLDLNPDNRVDVLKNTDICKRLLDNIGYLFVDHENGQCYLFDMNRNSDDIHKVKSIGYGAFWNCKSLKKIRIPDSVNWIGYKAFWNCSSLTSIKIPDSVENIKNSAFERCNSLTCIKILRSVKSIGDNAFYDCTSLKEVVFEGKTIDQVEVMENYPWGLENISIIKCLG